MLVANGLRDRVRAAGRRRPAHRRATSSIAALLGAEEFGFATAPLVAIGCVMLRNCHLNTCPVGIATQDPELRARFTGTPEHVVRYFLFVAESVRELLADARRAPLDDVVGRVDLLRRRRRHAGRGSHALDLAPLIAPRRRPLADGPQVRRRAAGPRPRRRGRPRVAAARRARRSRARPVVDSRRIRNTDRSPGAMLAGEIAAPRRADGLAGSITLKLRGAGGQSLGAFAPARPDARARGRRATTTSARASRGGTLVVRPPRAARYAADEQRHRRQRRAVRRDRRATPTSRGRAGERFAVRNSGATRRRRGRRRPRLRVHDGRRASSCSAPSAATSRRA